MEKFANFTKPTYFFSTDLGDIDNKVMKNIQGAVKIDFDSEKFIAACWVDQLGNRGDIFLMVTDNRVIAKKPNGLHQNYFADITGMERSMTGDIVIAAQGNKADCFNVMVMPSKKLLDKMFDVINSHWTKSKSGGAKAQKSSSDDIPAQLEKLAKLKDQGILTEQEFKEKKADLLSRM